MMIRRVISMNGRSRLFMCLRNISTSSIKNKSPTPLTLQMMKCFSEPPSNLKVRLASAHFLSSELPIRYIVYLFVHALDILRTLPSELNNTTGILELISLYTSCLQRILSIQTPTNEEEDSNFTGILSTIQKDFRKVYPLMAWGIYELKQKRLHDHTSFSAFEEEVISSALDDFVLFHISGIVLLAQHVVSMYKRGGRISRIVAEESISEAIQRSVKLTIEHYNIAPEVHLQVVTPPKQTFEYIPTHIHHICFELLKNSLRATIEYTAHQVTNTELSKCTPSFVKQYVTSNSLKPPPIDVIISQGRNDLSIKISDRGGGVPRSIMPQLFLYTSTTALPPTWLLHNPSIRNIPDMRNHYAGLGYGLPVARAYAKYFGGDLKLFPMEGWGTDAYVHICRLADMKEIII